MKKFFVIGIPDSPDFHFAKEVEELFTTARVFSGGKRHHELVGDKLPVGTRWIDITVPLDDVFRQYSAVESPIVVFASGDPLFFGFANTIRRKMPDAEIIVYPWFNSLQTLAHRMVIPYHDMRIVSLTGRDWPEFDRALIERADKIGLLTDRQHSPSAIAQRMIEYGYTQYQMTIGEHLGNREKEKVRTISLSEAAHDTSEYPNCLILQASSPLPPRRLGIPDHEFMLLDGRSKMITKMPIRLLSLQAMDLYQRREMWDVGFCTGSVSVEARLQFPHLHITSFEIRQEGRILMQENCHRFGAPGIEVHIGDFMQEDLSVLKAPDAVFIGGHGGHLRDMMHRIYKYLRPGGCIVMNAVISQVVPVDSRAIFEATATELGMTLQSAERIQLDEFNPIIILKAIKQEL